MTGVVADAIIDKAIFLYFLELFVPVRGIIGTFSK